MRRNYQFQQKIKSILTRYLYTELSEKTCFNIKSELIDHFKSHQLEIDSIKFELVILDNSYELFIHSKNLYTNLVMSGFLLTNSLELNKLHKI